MALIIRTSQRTLATRPGLRAGQAHKNAYKSLIAAEYSGVEVEHVKELQMGVSDKTHLFLNDHVFVDRNRLGMVPVLETPEGSIVESNAMARYVAKFKGDDTLCGSSPYEFIQIEQWIAFATKDIDEVLTRWVYLRIGYYPYNALSEQILIAYAKRALGILNTNLAPGYEYLVGDCLTLADIVMTCNLYFGFAHVMAKSFTSEFPHVERYFWNLVARKEFKKFLGELKQADPLPERERPRRLILRSDLIKAVNKWRRDQMIKEEGVDNLMIKEAQEEEGVDNLMIKEAQEGVDNQMIKEAQEEEGVDNLMIKEAQEEEGVDNQMIKEAQEEEGVDNLVLHAGVLDKREACKTLITAEYCGVKVVIVGPAKKYSVLVTGDGPVFDNSSMPRYIAKLKGDLYPSSVYEYAQVEEWMEFAATEIEEGLKKWIYPRTGLGQCDPYHWMGMRMTGVQRSLRVLNTHLATNKKYLLGNRITLADIAMTCALHFGFTLAMTKSFTSKFPHVERYFWNLVDEPNFKKFLGEVKQAESLPEWSVEPSMLDKKYVDLDQIIEARKKQRVNQVMEAHKENEKIDEQRESVNPMISNNPSIY